MLARGGEGPGRQIVPAAWIAASTRVGPGSPTHLYGYHIWLSPCGRRNFTLRGHRGQWVPVEPASKTVLVQTSLRDDGTQELFPLFLAAAGYPWDYATFTGGVVSLRWRV
jgi:hypothetical protein